MIVSALKRKYYRKVILSKHENNNPHDVSVSYDTFCQYVYPDGLFMEDKIDDEDIPMYCAENNFDEGTLRRIINSKDITFVNPWRRR